MSTLNTTTVATRPTTLNNTTDVGKSYFETDSNKVLVWDGTGWNEWNADLVLTPGFNNNYSADLDGSDDYLDLGSSTYFDTSTALTVSGWVTLDTFTSYPIFCSLKTSTSTGWKIGFSQQSGYDTVFMGSNSNFAKLKGGSTQLQSDLVSDWQHIAVTYNGSGATTAGNYKLYVNGSEQTLSASGAFATTSNVSYIGRDSGGNYLNGQIDEFSIFSSELTGQQVSDIYNSGVGAVDISSLNPLAWWRMGDTGTEGSSGSSTISNAASGTNSLGSSADATWQNGTSGNTSPTYSTDAP
jgi:hypothetical protein